jgi:hypothetical protein
MFRTQLSAPANLVPFARSVLVLALVAVVPLAGAQTTVVTASGDASVPAGFFSSPPTVVHFEACAADHGLPTGVAFVSSGGVIGSPTCTGGFPAALWDYAEESPTSDAWATASLGLIFDFSAFDVLEVGLLFTDAVSGGSTITFEAWSAAGASGSLLASVAAFRGDDGTNFRSLADDCFFGIKDAGPIRSVRLRGNGGGGIEGDVLRFVSTPAGCLGDMDCDGDVDFFDIDPFVAKLGCPGAGASCDDACPWQNGDVDQDGDVDFFDIDPFVGRLGATCP